MYRTILIWTVSFIVSGLIASKTSFASEVNSSVDTKASISHQANQGKKVERWSNWRLRSQPGVGRGDPFMI